MAIIYGTTGADFRNGTVKNDTIYGWTKSGNPDGISGNDTLFGNAGDDSVYGGTGKDSLKGDDGNDALLGGADDDWLGGGRGNDSLYAGGDNDTLFGGPSGNDLLDGNKGNDQIFGESGNDTLNGNQGDDTLDGGIGVDVLIGGAGNDLYIYSSKDTIVEDVNQGIDRVESAVTYSLDENIENLILTGGNAISATGNELDNLIIGNTAPNSIFGYGGSDTLIGTRGIDLLYGGKGNDTYILDSVTVSSEDVLGNGTSIREYRDPDVISENLDEGIDSVESSIFDYQLTDNVENLILTGSSNNDGGGNELNNTVTGNPGNNRLSGAAGDDLIVGGAGDDNLTDIYFRNFRGAVNYFQGGDDTLYGGIGNDIVSGIDGNDYLSGDDGNDVLFGDVDYENTGYIYKAGSQPGNDTLVGGKGNDNLSGNDNSDTLTGGSGADNFRFSFVVDGGIFDTYNDGIDTITDFVADDTIVISQAGFNFGAISPEQFVIGTTATTANHRFIYNQNSGALSFDTDGIGNNTQVQFAILSPGLVMTNADIIIG